jgi:hypothetical protein
VTSNRREFLKNVLTIGANLWVGPYAAGALMAHTDDASSLRDRVAQEAERIIASVRHTKYQHDAYIDVATGTYDVDCSEYVSYVLGLVSKRHLALIPKEPSYPVPRAYKYCEYFRALRENAPGEGWQRIQHLTQTRRGDIIAWALPGGPQKDRDTGHVFVADTPSRVSEQIVSVPVFDSSTVKHYDDSRLHSDGGFHDGVGRGTIHFRVDAAGRPIAFQFGRGDHFHDDPIAIGRIKPLIQG